MKLNEMPNSDPRSIEYLSDNIFNNLLESESNNGKTQNKYVDQIIDKLKYFRIKSPNVYFEIDTNDLKTETIKQIEDFIQGCRTTEEKYIKLNGVVTEVIAQIAKQAKPLILSRGSSENTTWIEKSLAGIRELVSFRWKLIDGEGNE